MLKLQSTLFVLFLFLVGCSTLGGSASSLDTLADGYGYVRALRLTALDGMSRGSMTADRAERFQSIADQARMPLDTVGVFAKPDSKAPRDLADILAAASILAKVRGEVASMKPIDQADIAKLREMDDEAKRDLAMKIAGAKA